MTTERRTRPRTPPGIAATTGLQRIPLPALPHFRTSAAAPGTSPTTVANPAVEAPVTSPPKLQHPPAAAAGPTAQSDHLSPLEMSELLGAAHEGGIVPAIEPITPQRTGATGATILNDLVDEIEKGLERDLARAPLDVATRGYRRVVACAGGLLLTRPVPSPTARTERRTGE
jgi:hypothetical protein